MKKHLQKAIHHSKRFAQKRLAQLRPAPKTVTAEDVRITNETVAARREEVLGSARKFIYPLDAPRHRVVKWSVAILVTAGIAFFTFCLLELYKFQSTSSFIYGVTQVVPFPVAIVNHRQLVSYNDYLFEVRHYMHYYQTQQHTDFTSQAGRQRLAAFEKTSLDAVIQKAYVQQLADKYHLSVSEQEIDTAVAMVRTQNRLGASDEVFQSVLSEFWGWSVQDFRRELKNELLAQKVVSQLDTGTHGRAKQAYAQLQSGTDFSALAKQVSDDSLTKANGGEYGFSIDSASTQLSPPVLGQILKLQPGQYSTIIDTGYNLEIVKVLQVQGAQFQAAHISFNFQPISTYTDPLAAKQSAWRLVKL